MGTRAALTLAVLIVAAGCSSGNQYGGGGSGGSDMGFPAVDLGGAFCVAPTVTVTQSSATPPSKLTARAQVSGTRPIWSISRAGDPTDYTPVAVDESGYTVSFTAETSGTWTFHAVFPD